MKQAHVGDTWIHRESGIKYIIEEILPSHRFACYIRLRTNWLLPPRYFWDLFRKSKMEPEDEWPETNVTQEDYDQAIAEDPNVWISSPSSSSSSENTYS